MHYIRLAAAAAAAAAADDDDDDGGDDRVAHSHLPASPPSFFR